MEDVRLSSSKTEKLSDEFWLGLFSPVIIAGLLVAVAPLAILRAWVLTMLWDWYLVPGFGMAPLRVVYAFGVTLIVGYLLPRPLRSVDGSAKKPGHDLATALLAALFALAMGWVGTLFI